MGLIGILQLFLHAGTSLFDCGLAKARSAVDGVGGNGWVVSHSVRAIFVASIPALSPPRGLIAATVHVAMVAAAERDGELVADLSAQRAALGEAQVMGVTGLPAADQAGLLCDEPEVIAVTNTPRFGEEECGLVDGVATVALPGLALLLDRGCSGVTAVATGSLSA